MALALIYRSDSFNGINAQSRKGEFPADFIRDKGSKDSFAEV
jgi:hypothetical protein